MRVISGLLKRRKIEGFDIEGVRPTMSRIKESLFAILNKKIKGSLCLDLFAGTGSLGIEAISNGAEKVYFIDHNQQVINVLKKNLKHLDIESKSIVLCQDYMKALKKFEENKIIFDIVFLDPPYEEKKLTSILTFISTSNILNSNGQVICEYTNDNLNENYGELKLITKKKYGHKKIRIYQK